MEKENEIRKDNPAGANETVQSSPVGANETVQSSPTGENKTGQSNPTGENETGQSSQAGENKAGQSNPAGASKTRKNNLAKEKRRFYIKNKMVAIVVAIAAAIISLCAFLFPAIQNMGKYDKEMSILKETDYDYRVYFPLQSQVEELAASDSVKSVFAYYRYDASISYNGKVYGTNVVFSDDSSNLGISAYNEKRLLAGDLSEHGNYILLDKSCAEAIGAECGDIVTVKMKKAEEISVVVAGIFKDNTFFENGSAYLDYSGMVKEKINAGYEELKLAGILIKEKNSSCLNELKSYIPMGEMLSEDYFSNELEYEQYVREYMSRDYSSKIFNKKELSREKEGMYRKYAENAERMLLAGAIFYGVIFVLLCLQGGSAKRFVKEFSDRTKSQIPTKELLRKYIRKDITAAITGMALFVIGAVVLCGNTALGLQFMFTAFCYFGCAAIISLVVLLLVDAFMIKIVIYKGKNIKE